MAATLSEAKDSGECRTLHKTWTPAAEKELIEEWKRAGANPAAIPQLARRFDRSPEAIGQKLRRLGIYSLNVVGSRAEITTTFEAVKNLPSPEEVLKIVAGALEKAKEPGLGKTELQRLSTIVALSKEYREGLREFVNYQAIEAKLTELEKKYVEWAREKTKGHASRRDHAKVVQAAEK